jgi:hypothetical protein
LLLVFGTLDLAVKGAKNGVTSHRLTTALEEVGLAAEEAEVHVKEGIN